MSKKSKTKKSSGKGHFEAIPITFISTDGVEHTYGGRGRYCLALAQLVVRDKKVPARDSSGAVVWRDANPEELASSQELVDNVTNRIKEKAAAREARVKRRAEREARKAAAREAAVAARVARKDAEAPAEVPVKVRKPRAKKEVVTDVPAEVPVAEVPAEVPVTATETTTVE